MTLYDATPAGGIRRGLIDGSFAVKGDAAKTVDAMIVAADADRCPLRLTLGSTAYASISRALADRLQSLEAQRNIALSADRT